jgi:hypothetical protein
LSGAVAPVAEVAQAVTQGQETNSTTTPNSGGEQ